MKIFYYHFIVSDDEEESEQEESEEEEEEDEDEEESEEEESEEEEEVEEEEVSEQDASEEDKEEEEEKQQAAPVFPATPAPVEKTKSTPKTSSTDEDDDDDGSIIDDGNIEDTLKKKPKKKKEKLKVKALTAPSPEDNEEDAAMKALLNEWGGDVDDDDDSDDDEEEESDATEREVQLDDNVIDHIVLAAPDLDDAMADFEKMTGIAAVIAGTINGLGIKCARISFNDSSYLEIIAPDPKSPGPIGQLIKNKGIKELTPFAFALRSSRAEDLKEEVKKFGYVPDHITMFGGKKDGTQRKWELLFLYGHKIGGICPYFVNWHNSDHPCATLPVVGKLKKFTVRAPGDDPVHQLLEHVDVQGINIEVGKTKMSFQFSSPEGTVKFAASKAVGFKFPGFDDEENELDVEACAAEDDDVAFENPQQVELLEIPDGEYEALPPPAY